MKVKNNAFGKSQDYNTTMPRQKNVNKLKVSGKKSLTKKSSLLQQRISQKSIVRRLEYKDMYMNREVVVGQ